ncbi:MAG: hypothetical protein ABR567_04725 [Myxococcales bacterium]|nr:hypothetical protein [Myxococcales bacterium]
MQTCWIRPAVAALFWLLIAASTLSELGTLPPPLPATVALRTTPENP